MQHTKALFLAALLVGIGTVTLINEIGIGRYPSTGQFADGVMRGFRPPAFLPPSATAPASGTGINAQPRSCKPTPCLLAAGAFTLASALGLPYYAVGMRAWSSVVRGVALRVGGLEHHALTGQPRALGIWRRNGLPVLADRPTSTLLETRKGQPISRIEPLVHKLTATEIAQLGSRFSGAEG